MLGPLARRQAPPSPEPPGPMPPVFGRVNRPGAGHCAALSPAAKMFCATGIADAHEPGGENNIHIHLCPSGIVPRGSGWVARTAGLQAKRKRDHPFLRRKDGRVLLRHTISRERCFRGISNPRQTVSQLSVATEGKKGKGRARDKVSPPGLLFCLLQKIGSGVHAVPVLL